MAFASGSKAHRMGDANTGGGTITSIPQSKVFVMVNYFLLMVP